MPSSPEASAARVLARLHEELSSVSLAERWQPSGHPPADELLHANPFAFLLAVIADYGIPAERAWILPYRLHKALGELTPRRLAPLSGAQLESAIRAVEGHRFPGRVADFYIKAAHKVLTEYAGDTSRVWSGRGLRDVDVRFRAFLGIGQKKSSMAVNILCRDLGWLRPPSDELRFIDVSFDIHLRRVFLRSGLATNDTLEAIVDAGRRWSPEYPGKLDRGAWRVGRQWCRPSGPDCGGCPLTAVCSKLLQRGSDLRGT